MITRVQSRSYAAPSFSERELTVLKLLAKGESIEQIRDTLGMETPTAEVHIDSIIAKLRAINGMHTVAVANPQQHHQFGILEPRSTNCGANFTHEI
jgi:DNA-binding NarL/FixJ family response regulator